MSAAQPILPSRNSLLYQLNISRTSVKDQHKRGTSASCQLNIRGPSEEHQNIRRTSEEDQRSMCAVIRRRFPVGARPTRRMLQPEATGAVREVTNWLKPL